jgi:hypothetical protein
MKLIIVLFSFSFLFLGNLFCAESLKTTDIETGLELLRQLPTTDKVFEYPNDINAIKEMERNPFPSCLPHFLLKLKNDDFVCVCYCLYLCSYKGALASEKSAAPAELSQELAKKCFNYCLWVEKSLDAMPN